MLYNINILLQGYVGVLYETHISFYVKFMYSY